MTAPRKSKVFTGLTMASSLAWMSILPATAVFAQSAPTVTPGSVSLSGPIHPTNGSATFTANASDPGGTPEYQFWVESPTGTWSDMQNYSTTNTFTLATPSAGDYLVVVDVMDQAQVASGQWNMAQTTMPDGVFNGSTVLVMSNASGEVAKGQSVTLTATSSGIFDPLYQFWYQAPDGTWNQSGAYSSSNTFTFTAGQSGPYKYVAYAKSPAAANDQYGALESNVGMQVAYGAASQVVVSPASQTVVADHQAQGQATYTVEDSQGDKVANFTGTLTLSDNGAGLGISTGGMNSGDAYAVTSGVATVAFAVPTGDAGTTVAISADNLMSTTSGVGGVATQSQVANVNYNNATAMVSAAAATASALMLTSDVSGLANNALDTAVVTVRLADQAGKRYVSATNSYFADLTLQGSGSFSSASTLTSEVVQLTAGTSVASASVYTPQGGSGTVTVSATPISGDPLAAATPVTISLYETTPANHLAISSSMGLGSNGETYTTYTVKVEDAAGNVISTGSGSGANGSTLNVSANSGNLEFSVGARPTATAVNTGLTGLALTNGVGTFTVENTLYQTSPATIKVTDSHSTIAAATASYTYMVGAPGYAKMISTNYVETQVSYVTAGATLTETAQLTDVNGNPVRMANQPLYFIDYAETKGDLVLPNGASTYGDTYVAMTNASGQASITMTVPTTDTTWEHAIAGVSGSLGFLPVLNTDEAYSPYYYVTPPSEYATSLAANVTGGTVSAGFSTGTVVTAYNSLGAVASGEWWGSTIQVTSSNSGVLSVASPTATLSANGVSSSDTITAGLVGTATLTFTDISQPNEPSTSVTYTVVPGSATFTPWIEYQGAQLSSTNSVSLAANSPVELQVVNVDQAGNPIPVLGSAALVVTLPTLSGGLAWETVNGGPSATSAVQVDIAPGSSSANVWIVSSASASVSTPTTAYDNLEYAATNISATTSGVSAGSATVTWSRPSAGDPTNNYQVWVIPFSGGSADLALAYEFGSAGPGATAATVTGLTSGSTYEFNVDATYSSPSAVVKGVPGPSGGVVPS